MVFEFKVVEYDHFKSEAGLPIAEMIRKAIPKNERFKQLKEIAEYQLNVLNKKDSLRTIKKLSDDIYLDDERNE